MESVIFDMADFDLPYNGFLGCLALAKFMAAAHYVYVTMNIAGPIGPISAPMDVENSMACAKKLYWVAVAVEDDNKDRSVRKPSAP